MSDIVKNVIAALLGAAILAVVAWLYAGYKGFLSDIGKISKIEESQAMIREDLAKQRMDLDSLAGAGYIKDVTLSLGTHQIRDLSTEYTASTAGFVIASVESLGYNNHGVICGLSLIHI